MSNINEMNPQSGRFKNEDNENVNLADILGRTIRTGSLYGTIDIGTTATPLRLGATDLEDRHTLQVINTGANNIFIGFDDLVTINNGLPCESGVERSFDVDPNDPITLYAIAEATTTIRIVEVH